MLTNREKTDVPETVNCPHCGREIKTLLIVNKGFIKGRPHVAGGPYYQHKCIYCHKDFDCFFEKEVFTRKPSTKKAFIFRLSRSVGRLFGAGRDSPARIGCPADAQNNTPEQPELETLSRLGAGTGENLPTIFRIHPELLTAFRALGLEPDASVNQIKRKYKRLVKSFHPDKAGHLGAREREEATKKLIEINKAYGTIKELFM